MQVGAGGTEGPRGARPVCGPAGDARAGARGCPLLSTPTHTTIAGSPQSRTQDRPSQLRSEVAAGRALLTPAEVGEDVVLPEVGSDRTCPGVAVAEAAAAAGWAVGLQAKCARAASAMEADMPTGAR